MRKLYERKKERVLEVISRYPALAFFCFAGYIVAAAWIVGDHPSPTLEVALMAPVIVVLVRS